MTQLGPGSRLGNYILVRRLAAGGMAEVFLARYVGLAGFERTAVVKCVLPHLATDARYVDLFLREARLAARITHPNVCQVHDLGESDGQYFIAMERLEGVSLGSFAHALKSRGPTNPRLVASLIADACEGLHHAHDATDENGQPLGLIHRDVTPGNLFVTTAGAVKVLDFGVAKASLIGTRTETGVLMGTFTYMSPEQLKGQPIDRRSDVFALGAVTAELLLQQPLFLRETEYLVSRAIVEDDLPSIGVRRPDLPPGLVLAVDHALKRPRDERTPTARDFGRELVDAVRPLGGVLAPHEIAELLAQVCAPELDAQRDEVPVPKSDVDTRKRASAPSKPKPSPPRRRLDESHAGFEESPTTAPSGIPVIQQRLTPRPTALPARARQEDEEATDEAPLSMLLADLMGEAEPHTQMTPVALEDPDEPGPPSNDDDDEPWNRLRGKLK